MLYLIGLIIALVAVEMFNVGTTKKDGKNSDLRNSDGEYEKNDLMSRL